MSRRTGVIGLVASAAVLLLTVVVATGIGPSLPGPPVREWLGVGDPPLPDACAYDPDKVRNAPGRPPGGTWRREPRSPSPSPELGAIAVGGYVYLVGGQGREATERTLLRFDPHNGEYRREPDMPVALDHPAVAAHDGEVIVAGGYVDGTVSTDRAWTYSPATRRWRELPPMRSARGAAAGAVVGDRLYVAGGVRGFGNEHRPLQSMEVFDFRSGRWLAGPKMPTARHHFGAATAGGRIYFAGGRQPDDLSQDALEAFDPDSGRWSRLPPLPIGSGALAVAAAGGEIVATGGGDDRVMPPGSGWVLRAAYSYNLRTRRWHRLPDMRRPRHGHASATVGSRVYVFRGIPCPGYGQMASVESLGLR